MRIRIRRKNGVLSVMNAETHEEIQGVQGVSIDVSPEGVHSIITIENPEVDLEVDAEVKEKKNGKHK